MTNLKPIVHTILEDYALPWHGTHGVGHWTRVLENGLRLAKATGANIEIIQLFAVFHDAPRINESVDDGQRHLGRSCGRSMTGLRSLALAAAGFDATSLSKRRKPRGRKVKSLFDRECDHIGCGGS
ncbi:MAG: hypothetical protein ABSG86_21155 [Thermoguttaceae bacterium]|jgi:hypothetical protein